MSFVTLILCLFTGSTSKDVITFPDPELLTSTSEIWDSIWDLISLISDLLYTSSFV